MAIAQFIKDGRSTDYTPGADVAAGAVVVQNDLVGIAHLDILSGALGSLSHDGEYELPKTAATAYAAGVIVYWDAGAQEITETALGNTYFGKVSEAALAGDAKVRARIDQ